MREYIFHGKRIDNSKWVEGYYVKAEKLDKSGYEHFIIEVSADGASHLVYPESVGQYTGMNEFVVTGHNLVNILECVRLVARSVLASVVIMLAELR